MNDDVKIEVGSGGVSAAVSVGAIPWAALFAALAPLAIKAIQAWLDKQAAAPTPPDKIA